METLKQLLHDGKKALETNDTAMALKCFEQALELERDPVACSGLAYCLAKERHAFSQAKSLCAEALRQDPRNPEHYLIMGRIYMLAGNKRDAIRIFRKGLKFGFNRQIRDELETLGERKSPVLPFLDRKNPINKYLGKLFVKLGMR
ncbi:MAG: tetratricopeptide repeat protein [Geobacter sp.]|nr:tetratricopeptide repeat protein [Geobacter sp.]